jgi:dihydrofolate reductase
VPQGPTPFTFITEGIVSAIEQAKGAAGDKQVYVMGSASLAGQCLQAGLLDEIQLHLVPLLLGQGIRLFDHIGITPIQLEPVQVIEEAAVTHLRFRVVK